MSTKRGRGAIFPIISLLLVLLFYSKITLAFNVSIHVKNTFTIGDLISFNYTISSNKEETLIFIPFVKCPNKPMVALLQQRITVSPSHPYFGVYEDQRVANWLEPQKCKAVISILSPIQKTFSKDFEIETKPSFVFRLNLNKKVFALNENIEINFNSSVSNPKISAELILPDNTTKKIELPYKAKLEEVGVYTIDVRVEKEGYKSTEIKDQFAVIKEKPKIRKYNLSSEKTDRENITLNRNKGNYTTPKEHKETVATDLYKSNKRVKSNKQAFKSLFWWYILIGAFAISALIFFIFFVEKRL